MSHEEYRQERMKKLAMNIADLEIGMVIKDSQGLDFVITNKTRNSVELLCKKRTVAGITCKNWIEIWYINKEYTW